MSVNFMYLEYWCDKHEINHLDPDCPQCLKDERDRYKEALERIKGNAESMLIAQNAIGTPDDAPERINARWVYSEARAALRPE